MDQCCETQVIPLIKFLDQQTTNFGKRDGTAYFKFLKGGGTLDTSFRLLATHFNVQAAQLKFALTW